MNKMRRLALKVFGLLPMAAKSFTLKDPEFIKWFGVPTYSGKTVTTDSALQVAVAWACVRVLAETIGNLPLAMFERDETGNAKKANHPLGELLGHIPNEDMTSVEYREALVSALALHGNAYSLIERNGVRGISSLYPLDSSRMTIKRDDDTRIITYEYQDERGRVEKLPRDKVWHVKGFGANGLMGFSPVSYAKQALGVALAVEEFQARFFGNGAMPSWLISIPQWLEEDQRAIARENIAKLWGGASNAHKAQLLEGGMTATPATMPLEDAQFLQLRGFGIQEICRIYRIPPHMVMDLSRSTNNNIEHQGQEFVTFTLSPYLTRIEASAARWLMTPLEREKYFLRFNVDALLRADAAGRAALYSSGVQNGWLARNEVRALENRNSVEGLDGFTAQSNLLPVDALFDDARRNAAPKTPEVRVAA